MSYIRRFLRYSKRSLKRSFANQWIHRHMLARQASILYRYCQEYGLNAVVDKIIDNPRRISSCQKRSEILGLLGLITQLQPQRIYEIGAYGGGTLFLFAQAASPQARLLSMDLDYWPGAQIGYCYLKRKQQQITCLAGDSHRRM